MNKKPLFKEELLLWKKGYHYVIGTDEVGRGAFAGPVVTAAVVFNNNLVIDTQTKAIIEQLGINDSKLLTPKIREKLVPEIKKLAISWSIAKESVSTINNIGIGKATQKAFRKVLRQAQEKLGKEKYFVLIDGFHVQYVRGIGLKNQKAIIKGDQKSISIAAASILAKVYRDNLMKDLDKKHPQYGFAIHKGYGTKLHQESLKRYGLSKHHRTSFNLSRFSSLSF